MRCATAVSAYAAHSYSVVNLTRGTSRLHIRSGGVKGVERGVQGVAGGPEGSWDTTSFGLAQQRDRETPSIHMCVWGYPFFNDLPAPLPLPLPARFTFPLFFCQCAAG